MKITRDSWLLGGLAFLIIGQQAASGDHPMPANDKPAVLMAGLGNQHHPVFDAEPRSAAVL